MPERARNAGNFIISFEVSQGLSLFAENHNFDPLLLTEGFTDYVENFAMKEAHEWTAAFSPNSQDITVGVNRFYWDQEDNYCKCRSTITWGKGVSYVEIIVEKHGYMYSKFILNPKVTADYFPLSTSFSAQ